MTAFDRAFIRAYGHSAAPLTAASPDDDRAPPAQRQPQSSADVANGGSALHPPARQAPEIEAVLPRDEPIGSLPETSPEPPGDNTIDTSPVPPAEEPRIAEITSEAFTETAHTETVSTGATSQDQSAPPRSTPQNDRPAEVLPPVRRPEAEDSQRAGFVHRIDPAAAAALEAGSAAQTVPPPHIAARGQRPNGAKGQRPNGASGQHSNASGGSPIPGHHSVGDWGRSISDEMTGDDASADVASEPFSPMLQVDRFNWPKVCRRLNETVSQELDRLADGLVAEMTRGRKVLGIGGCRSGEGATTLLICAGRRLAERGFRVALVDAHPANPKLARRLGLLASYGFEDVLSGQMPLEEVLIESAEDGLTVLPMCNPAADAGRSAEQQRCFVQAIRTLAANYDLVLVDPGPLEADDPDTDAPDTDWSVRAIAARLDAVALVHNAHTTDERQLAQLKHSLAAGGIAQAGIIQNFVAD